MAFQHAILPEEQLILVRFDGPVSVTEFQASAHIVCSDARYMRSHDGLIDLTGVSVTISASEIKDLVAFTHQNRKEGYGRWAVIVSSPLATAFTMLYHQRVADELPFALFSTYEGASEFLGRSVDQEFFEAALSV